MVLAQATTSLVLALSTTSLVGKGSTTQATTSMVFGIVYNFAGGQRQYVTVYNFAGLARITTSLVGARQYVTAYNFASLWHKLQLLVPYFWSHTFFCNIFGKRLKAIWANIECIFPQRFRGVHQGNSSIVSKTSGTISSATSLSSWGGLEWSVFSL